MLPPGTTPDDLCDWERICALLAGADIPSMGTMTARAAATVYAALLGHIDAVHLHTNRHVVITTGCNSWDHGLDVVVEGEAMRETSNDVLAQLAKAWSAKWDGRWQYDARDAAFHHPGGGEALVFRVAVRKILAFGKGTFTHTSYRFAT